MATEEVTTPRKVGRPRTVPVAPEPDETTGEVPQTSRDLLASASLSPDAQIDELREKTATAKAKRGRKSAEVKEAEVTLDLVQMVRPSLSVINAAVRSRWPEFGHSEDELDAIAIAASKVLAKYVDTAAGKYQEEIVLAVLLGGSLADKGMRFAARRKIEARSKSETPEVQIGGHARNWGESPNER